MNETIRHGLPLLAAGQAQKEVTHNEALLAIDRQLHLAVETRSVATPPSVASQGSSFIVAAGAVGAWAGHANAIATYDGYGWIFVEPTRGCLAWVADEAVFTVYDAGWLTGGWPVSALRIAGRTVLGANPVEIVAPNGGTTIDTEARATLTVLLAALREQRVVI